MVGTDRTSPGKFGFGKWDPEHFREIVWLVKYYFYLARRMVLDF